MSTDDVPDRFEILEELIHDDVQVCVRARDSVLGREVLLETPGRGVAELLRSATSRDRLLREARMLARVKHPAVMRLLDVVETKSGPTLVLDPRPGETLADMLERSGKLSPEQVRELGQKVAEAAQAVHEAGVVHRGLDERNILIQLDGTPVLTGFAFSKPLPSDGTMSSLCYRADESRSQSTVLPSHPAPEQLVGHGADARSDVFGLGCVLFRCLTGKPAFENAADAWRDAPEPFSFPEAPGLAAVIRKCLAQSPLQRYQRMSDVAAALAHADVLKPRSLTWLKYAGAAAGLVIAGLGVWAMWSPGSARGGGVTAGSEELPSNTPYAPYASGGRALLIGSNYAGSTFDTLPNAERDIVELKPALEALGWQVQMLRGPDANEARIKLELDRLRNEAGRDDQVFVYFAGHGETGNSDDVGWAIPNDGEPAPAPGFEGKNWVHFVRFHDVFSGCDAKHILVALDCCHGGTLAEGATRGAAPANQGRAALQSRLRVKAHFLVASSRANQKSWDGPENKHSPFARVFLELLERAKTEPVDMWTLFPTLRNRLVGQNPVFLPKSGNVDSFSFVFHDLKQK